MIQCSTFENSSVRYFLHLCKAWVISIFTYWFNGHFISIMSTLLHVAAINLRPLMNVRIFPKEELFLIRFRFLPSFRLANLELRWQLHISSRWLQLGSISASGSHLSWSIPSRTSHSGAVRDILVRWQTNRQQSSRPLPRGGQQMQRRRAMVRNWARIHIIGYWWSAAGMAEGRIPGTARALLLRSWRQQSVRPRCGWGPLSRLFVCWREDLRHQCRSDAGPVGIPSGSMLGHLSSRRSVDVSVLVASHRRRFRCKYHGFTLIYISLAHLKIL